MSEALYIGVDVAELMFNHFLMIYFGVLVILFPVVLLRNLFK